MKKAFTVLLSSLFLLSFSSLAEEDLHNSLIIQAIPQSEGTVVIRGQPKYEKTFKLNVVNTTNQPIKFDRSAGCYKAFDEKGKGFDLRTVQVDLLKTLKDDSSSGEVSFISDDDSVYNAKFIKWSAQCPHQSKGIK